MSAAKTVRQFIEHDSMVATWDECDAIELLLDAWEKEHPADEQQTVTRAWLRAAGFKRYAADDGLAIGDFRGGYYMLQTDVDSAKVRRWRVLGGEVKPPKTIGELRVLCRALGIELTEQTK